MRTRSHSNAEAIRQRTQIFKSEMTCNTCPGCLASNMFTASDTHYYCKQCERRGNAVQYLRDFHCLSFKEACRQLGLEMNKAPHTILSRQLHSCDLVAGGAPGAEWQEIASEFVMDCHYRLMRSTARRSLLYDQGFTDGTMQRFCLGWHEALHDDSTGWPPVGIVIPTFDATTKRLVKIRVQPEDTPGVYVSISGRVGSAGIYGDGCKHVVVVESELVAMLLQQCAGDICCPVALGGCKGPDKSLDTLLRDARLVLFANDATAFTWWVRRYPTIVRWKLLNMGGRDEAFGLGVMLRRWVLDGIQHAG